MFRFDRRMIKQLTFVALVSCASALAFAQTPAPKAGNAEAGQGKSRLCEGCHGIPDWRTAYPEVYSVPRLGGQHPEYIVKALQEYKGGEREHPSMRSIAASLSDQDMADLAAYYGQAPAAPAKAASK
jgi:cytochrome c553